jgi:hypothetical protein
VDRADRDDGRIERVVLAAHERLQIEHDARGDDDRVDGRMRRGAVAALALDENVHAIDVDQRQAFGVADEAVRQARIAMQTETVVGARETFEQAVLEHLARAGADFLRRLADENQGAAPLFLEARQDARCTDPAGHVHVVAAGVHDADVVAFLVARAQLAGVGNPGLFNDGQSVHVGANEDRRAVAVLEDADDAMPTDFLGDFEAEGLEFLRQSRGGFLFLVGQFRECVKLFVKRVEAFDLGIDAFVHQYLAFLQIVGDVLGRLGLQRVCRRQEKRHDCQHP